MILYGRLLKIFNLYLDFPESSVPLWQIKLFSGEPSFQLVICTVGRYEYNICASNFGMAQVRLTNLPTGHSCVRIGLLKTNTQGVNLWAQEEMISQASNGCK